MSENTKICEKCGLPGLVGEMAYAPTTMQYFHKRCMGIIDQREAYGIAVTTLEPLADKAQMRDALIRQQEHLRGLLRDCIVYTGQEGSNDGLAPGAFCRYCSEEIPLDRLLDGSVVWSEHSKSCTVFKLGNWIKEIDAVLGKGE